MIKIDQSFVADLVEEGASHAIVSKTIELTQLLDLLVGCEEWRLPSNTTTWRISEATIANGVLCPVLATGNSTSPWVIGP